MTKKVYDFPTTGNENHTESENGQNDTKVAFGNATYSNEKVKPEGSDGLFRGETNISSKKDEESEKDGEKKEEPKSVSLSQLFRYATCGDVLLMLLGTFCACLHGAALPGLIILFGDMTDLFIENGMNFEISNATYQEMLECDWAKYGYDISDSNQNLPPPADTEKVLTECGKEHILEEFERDAILGLLDQMGEYALYYVYLGIAVLFLAYGQVAFWLIPSYRQTQRARTLLFGHIMRQEVGWFDVTEVSELNTRLSEDINKIQEGIGDKVSNFFQWFSTFLAGIIIGFVYGWKLCLVILATSPLLVISGGIMTMMTTNATQKELSAYAKAGAVAEEVFSSIRTVVAFGGEQKESKRYREHLDEAKDFGIRKAISNGIGMGLVFFIIFAVYALAFWYGARLVREDDYTAGRMLIVFFCVLIGAFALGNAAPSLSNIAAARGAAFLLWEILDRQSVIDSYSTEGEIPSSVNGTVNFVDVKFKYPSRPEIPILTGLNIQVNRGQTIALVGASGCGKSTVVQLLQRFYDPESGSVQIDGKDIRSFNLKWLRQHIGVVSQEPVLFDTTIMENIKFGREDVTDEEVEKATKEANAYSFIMGLPHKYDTLVGDRGAQLSGGQKQRIAIARALVRDPKILLLDEATSALDTESEAIVQAALDHARVGRTTIVIAHRLSTIKNADLIYSLQNGKVYESGSHSDLMAKGESGIYYQLVNNQKVMETETGELFEEKEVPRPELQHTVSVVSTDESMRRKRGVSESEAGHKRNKQEDLPEASLLRIMKMNSSEWVYILIGCFAAIINGGVQPAYAMIFAEILGVFALPIEEQKEEALLYSMMFLVIAVCAGLAMFFQGYMFGKSGECLTARIRSKAFDSLLKQDIAYYDDHSNSTGALCTRLSTDAAAIQGATGVRLGTVCMSFAAIGTGIIIGFIYSWKLTLVILAFVPVLVIAGALQMKILAGQAGEGQEALETAGKVATQALENIRTVASLTKEQRFLAEYTTLTEGPLKANLKKAHAVGFTFSFTQAITFFAQAAAFYFGAWLVENDGLNFVDMFKVFMAIIFGAMGVGQAASFAPDYGKAKLSAARIFALFDRVPAIDSSSQDGEKPADLTGTIVFKNTHFSYPTRPTVSVLKGLNVTVKPKQVLAFVGSSGCGKSTSVSLMERFYDPQEGTVELDGCDIKKLNLQWLRSKMGIVQQEPVLFDRSIAENIAYGDNSREVPMDEVIKAARDANIHSFIETLPDGYDTSVGEKGTQLSGGQKQRVAIARALVRDPQILLLDEATSALDTESEKVVQEALDKAQKGRTTVVIAHRLSTIQNADCITVIRSGTVAEAGTHSELMAKKGFYHKLNFAQQRKTAKK